MGEGVTTGKGARCVSMTREYEMGPKKRMRNYWEGRACRVVSVEAKGDIGTIIADDGLLHSIQRPRVNWNRDLVPQGAQLLHQRFRPH